MRILNRLSLAQRLVQTRHVQSGAGSQKSIIFWGGISVVTVAAYFGHKKLYSEGKSKNDSLKQQWKPKYEFILFFAR